MAQHSDYAGQGNGKFMYWQALEHTREQGLCFAHVDTALDAAHTAARWAYEAGAFDRRVPSIDYWQDLSWGKLGSTAGE